MTDQANKPAWPFATVSKEPSVFTKDHEFNGVNRNKSIQSLKRRDSGGVVEPFAANKGILAPRQFTTYSMAEPLPTAVTKYEIQVQGVESDE